MLNLFHGRLLPIRIILLLAALALVAVGILTIYSVANPAETSPTNPTEELGGYWQKQLLYAFVGLWAMIGINLISYRKLGQISYWLFAAVLVMLAVILLDKVMNIPFVPIINGSRRWIMLRFAGQSVAIQPSELCQVVYIVALAWYLRYRSNYRKFSALIGPFTMTLLPMILILVQPDLGTVLLMMPILFMMLFVAGAKVKHLLLVILLAVMVSPLLWGKMNHYQRIRISSVVLQSQWVQEKAELHPRLGHILVGREFSKRLWENQWGYHLLRSKYAVADGGMYGHGFRQGPFVKYNFLPYRHNDFIFAVIAHQWGFLGSLALLSLYAIIVWCGIEIAGNNTDPFGRLIAVGIVTMFSVKVIVNISMTLGLMPITGLTLPMVSYGGSSLVVSLMAIGLLNNVGRHRPFTVAPKKD